MTGIPSQHDAIVVGAGFGGLGAALRLAERGLRPLVLEAMAIPGGCASTFRRRGREFEAGATLFAGLDEGGLFREWIDRHGIDVEIDLPDPVMELRTPDFTLTVPRDRDALIEGLCRLEPARAEGIRDFFALQRRVADLVWEGLRPDLVPPLRLRGLLGHARRLPRYAGLARLVGRSLEHVLRRFDLADVPCVRTFCDEVSQITVQCDAASAESTFALATLDYFSRGSGHVRGGIGRLAAGLVETIERLGGEVRFKHEVVGLRRARSGWRVETRRGEFAADHVVANVLPRAAARLTGDAHSHAATSARVRSGWGACMLYLVTAGLENVSPRHLALVADADRPLLEGNHVFCSISEEACGERTATVSTHVDLPGLLALPESDRAARVAGLQESMRRTIALRAPEIEAAVVDEMTASPRTFERFTLRPDGFVGGVPRRRGLAAYRGLLRRTPPRGLHLVGDSVLPGQSILATALGGAATADAIADRGVPARRETALGPGLRHDTMPA